MSKKFVPPLKIAPLQRIVAETITDAAEIAALDRAHRRAKRLQAAYESSGPKRNRSSATRRRRKTG
jgi:hypothetical protein